METSSMYYITYYCCIPLNDMYTQNNPNHLPFSARLEPDDAANVLMRIYSAQAREEALLRALLAERDAKADLASFWAGVFQRISFYRESDCSGHD